MSNITTFTSGAQARAFTFHLSEATSFTVRAVVDDAGAPWFVAADVCAALGYSHTPHAMRMLDDDEKGVRIVDTLGGEQSLSVINESGLYSLILGSRKPEAKPFKKWVTAEVLPALRRAGSYTMPAADTLPALPRSFAEALRLAADELEARQRAEAALALAAPKVEFVDRYVSAPTSSMGIREVVKLLKTNGHTVNEHSFTAWLVSSGFMYRKQSSHPDKPGRLTPAAQHEKAGRFETKTGQGTNGHTVPVYKFTGKGVSWIVGEWAKHQILGEVTA